MPLRGTVNDSTEVPFSEFPGAGVKTTLVSVLCYRTFSTEAGTVFKSLFEEMGQKTETVFPKSVQQREPCLTKSSLLVFRPFP